MVHDPLVAKSQDASPDSPLGSRSGKNFAYLGKQPVDQEMALCYNLEGFEFTHDLIALSLDQQAACLSMRFEIKT